MLRLKGDTLRAVCTTVASVALATWALTPAASLLAVVELIARLVVHSARCGKLQLASTGFKRLSEHLVTLQYTRSPAILAQTTLALLVAHSFALALSSPGALHLLNITDTLAALLLSSLFAILPPLGGLLLAEGAINLHRSASEGTFNPTRAGSRANELFCRALGFTLGGLVQEQWSGVGRTLWWVRGIGGELGWVRAWIGPGGVDLLFGLAGVALGEVMVGMWEGRKEEQGQRDLLREEEQEQDRGTLGDGVQVDRVVTKGPAMRMLLAIGLLALFSSSLPTLSTFHRTHPSPDLPSFVHPPLKVGCVAPRPRSGSRATTNLDDYLHETRIVAGRGAKIISWPEGAVRLEKGAGEGERDKDGWDGMGAQERELLGRVGEVASSSGVSSFTDGETVTELNRLFVQSFILATYLVPASLSGHKLHNVATLVGPSAGGDHKPTVHFSTTKHLSVPFIETYSLIPRSSLALGSSPDALPLARLSLPHPPKTPAPRLTPLQQVDLSAAICLDIASPSLFTHFLSSPTSSTHSQKRKLHTPSLILNPSPLPSSSLAPAQLTQLAARAIESNAYILRCDSGGGSGEGVSTLVGPDGVTRVWRAGREGWGSWEGGVDLERAAGKGWALFGGEWTVLGIGVMLMMLGEVQWATFGGRLRRLAGSAMSAAVSTERLQGREEEGRLVEVD